MRKKFIKIWNILTTVIVIFCAVAALSVVGVRLAGIKVYTVLSGSMEPAYSTGALIYVKEADPFSLEKGDVITFMLNEKTVATHRIVEVVPDEAEPDVLRFRTKGDANPSADSELVHYKNVLGTPVFTVPYLGYIVSYIQHPPGLYIAIAAAAVLILLIFLPEWLKNGQSEKKKKDSSKGDEITKG